LKYYNNGTPFYKPPEEILKQFRGGHGGDQLAMTALEAESFKDKYKTQRCRHFKDTGECPL